MAKPVQIVEELLHHAHACNASDIHLESSLLGLKIRIRIDGILHDYGLIDKSISMQVIARIKILSGMDIAERRLPQDGKFLYSYGELSNDIRCSSFPTLYGEKLVLRILYRSSSLRSLHELGLSEILYQQIRSILQNPCGLFIISGPTGSGKTTTLYALLRLLMSSEKNIVTLEDPIEYTIDGINQTQVHPEIGLTFAQGLRSLVRQDPDIILVGEIRDKETAEIAIQAALTGHLVLTTIHAQDAAHTIMRLTDMNIPSYFLSSTIMGIIAQRLVRIICTECLLTNVASCTHCNRCGYKGRTGIFEFMPMTDAQSRIIAQSPTYASIYCQAKADGMTPLGFDAHKKVASRITTSAECMRVLGIYNGEKALQM